MIGLGKGSSRRECRVTCAEAEAAAPDVHVGGIQFTTAKNWALHPPEALLSSPFAGAPRVREFAAAEKRKLTRNLTINPPLSLQRLVR